MSRAQYCRPAAKLAILFDGSTSRCAGWCCHEGRGDGVCAMALLSLMRAARPAPVGGFQVLRALPHRERRTVGPFCFLDRMGLAIVETVVRQHRGTSGRGSDLLCESPAEVRRRVLTKSLASTREELVLQRVATEAALLTMARRKRYPFLAL